MPSLSPSRITELSPHACWENLRHAQHGIGRLAFAAPGRAPFSAPELLPVNYVLNGPEVIMRTGGGLINEAADAGMQATFEIDELRPSPTAGHDVGWSVVVHGALAKVTDAMYRHYLELGRLTPSAGGFKPNFVQLQVDRISGRKIWPTTLDAPLAGLDDADQNVHDLDPQDDPRDAA